MKAESSQAYIGVDVGGTNLRFALVDTNGNILYQQREQTKIHLGWTSFIDRLTAGIAAVRGEAALHRISVGGVGAGIPGLIGNDGYVHSSVNLRPLEGMNLRETLSEATGLPVAVVNDANAFAYGEKAFGAGRPFKSFLILTLGTGVGSGLILDGKLWTGVDGCAGEYGHATVEPEGSLCGCGNTGCLEQYASATAIVSMATRALEKGELGALADIPPEKLDAEAVAVAAQKNDPLATHIFRQAGRYLGIASATAINLLNLEAVILAGGVAASFDLLEGPIRHEVKLRAFGLAASRVQILKGSLGDDAGILGSAALAMT